MLGMTLDDFLALAEREQDELVAPLIGWVWKPFGEPSFDGGGCYWKTGGGPRCASIINGGWPAFGAMWDALLAATTCTMSMHESSREHSLAVIEDMMLDGPCAVHGNRNLAVAAALWQANQKEGV